jgi:hypothetical protein
MRIGGLKTAAGTTDLTCLPKHGSNVMLILSPHVSGPDSIKAETRRADLKAILLFTHVVSEMFKAI